MFQLFHIEGLIIELARFLARLTIDTTDFLAVRQAFFNDIVRNDIADQTLALSRVADQQTTTILDAISVAAIAAAQDASNQSNRVIDTVTATVQAENREATAATSRIIAPVVNQVALIDANVSNLATNVASGIGTTNSLLGNVVSLLSGGLRTTINNQVIVDESVFGFVTGEISNVVVAASKSNAATVDRLTGTFGGIVDSVLGELFAERARADPQLAAIADAILHNKDVNTKLFSTFADGDKDGFGGLFVSALLKEIAPDLLASGDDLRGSLDKYIGGVTAIKCLGDLDESRVHDPEGISPLADKIISVIQEILAYVALPLALASDATQSKMHTWRVCHPYLLLPVAESILSLHRGIISDDAAMQNILGAGYTREDAEKLIQLGHSIPDITFIYNMFYRDLIDESGFDFSLRALGFAEGFIEPLKELAFFIPPVQDIITMAVREVFSPEIARKQGQFEDFPEDFAKFAKQQGVSREWAERYWAAHWSLPSVQMGYEMLHRGVINKERMSELLRALDVMPFWREPLIEISFRPFTRVDIRRMHRVGVLSDGDVKLAYLNLGYDDINAGLLRDFVLEINKEDELLTLDIASDLTRSSILNFYKDGIIPRVAAAVLLTQAGINVAAAELFLLGADFDLERAERKREKDIILDEFRFGGLTVVESADRIVALDFETRERELALLDLEALRVREIKQPSKADLDKFLKAGLLSQQEYLAQLDQLGYSSLWADKYLALIEKAA